MHVFSALFSTRLAYIDPNTGGMLFQLLAVLFAAISGAVLVFSRQIKSAFARLKRAFRERKGQDTPRPEDKPSP
ncbi:MAG TPA: hypothetical protein ENJ02_04320 [Chloroflexi bacterium]|nr:hypothetical protein [Chloroflexota bacterium]